MTNELKIIASNTESRLDTKKKIKQEIHTEYLGCPQGCCTFPTFVSIFNYDGETYRYHSNDTENNLLRFLEEVLDINIETTIINDEFIVH